MKTEDFVFVACRIFSLYLLYQAIFYLSFFVRDLFELETFARTDGLALLYLVPTALFGLFWFGARIVAQNICFSIKEGLVTTNLNKEEALSIGIVIVGLIVLAGVVPNFLQTVIAHMAAKSSGGDYSLIGYTHLIIRTIIGLTLVLGSRGYIKVIRHFRSW